MTMAEHLDQQSGFTLVEVLISLAISLVLISGLFGNYMLQLRVNSAQTNQTEQLGDLRLVSQIMRRELRLASNVTYDNTKKEIAYTTLDSGTGYFRYKQGGNDRLAWEQPPGTGDPSLGGYDEMVRGLDITDGLDFVSTGERHTITLKGAYKNLNREDKTLELKFRIWPRNLP